MRGLLCVPQSSKEQLRRSRTESSGVAPAIEELPGIARQVRPGGPRADSYQPTADFSRAGRSGGRPALQLPRASTPCGSSNIHLRPARVPQKPELLAPVVFSPIEEVWRAPGPPAPPTIIFSRKFEYPPPPRPRPAEAGIARFGTISSYRRGLEGVRPSSSPEYHFHTEVQHISLIPPTCRSICNQLSICYSKTMEQGENQDGSYAEKI